MKTSLAGAFVLCFFAAGCATPEGGTVPADKGEVRTGSNIPRKNRDSADRIDVIRAEDLERGRAGQAGMPASR